LAGAFAYSNVYAGGAIITLVITNIGTSKCELEGFPKLFGIRDGHNYGLPRVAHGTQDSALYPTALTPRESGALILDTSLGCNANRNPLPISVQYTGVIVVLPRGAGRVKISGVPLSDPCGLSESQLGWTKGFTFQ
jgi:hypothetical protein